MTRILFPIAQHPEISHLQLEQWKIWSVWKRATAGCKKCCNLRKTRQNSSHLRSLSHGWCEKPVKTVNHSTTHKKRKWWTKTATAKNEAHASRTLSDEDLLKWPNKRNIKFVCFINKRWKNTRKHIHTLTPPPSTLTMARTCSIILCTRQPSGRDAMLRLVLAIFSLFFPWASFRTYSARFFSFSFLF